MTFDGERELQKARSLVARINDLEPEIQSLSSDDLIWETLGFREQVSNGADLQSILPRAFAIVREASHRTIGKRHFDVQLMGGVLLHDGHIAEMATGEGKTLTAVLPAYLNALAGNGVHIVTVNDYLALRDRKWMGPVYEALGLSVSVLLSSHEPNSRLRHVAYATDVTYGTSNEFCFDYLRDNLATDLLNCTQRPLNYAIVDDIDHCLLDEASTPIQITKAVTSRLDMFSFFAGVVAQLTLDDDYIVDQDTHAVTMTEAGIDRVERIMDIADFYADMDRARLLNLALRAKALYQQDRDYLIRAGDIVPIDQMTGRPLLGRQYSEGLQQALQAREGLEIRPETCIVATTTFQNYFSLYRKVAGMSATAMTSQEEFHKLYRLDVVRVPPNVLCKRIDHLDLIYLTQHGKLEAIVRDVIEYHEAGQPILIGTTAIETSEQLSDLLRKQGVPHNVLNARYHEQEAQIIAQAGISGAVTIATNMAGRGTDIVLGGAPGGIIDSILRERDIDPEFATEDDRAEALTEAKRRCLEDRAKVVAEGGLYIIGTEHYDSRRIDMQLRGRAGRQGDPGMSRFFCSLEDSLLLRMRSDRSAKLLRFLGTDEDTPIETRMVSRMIVYRQAQDEGFDFDRRRQLKAFDDEIAAQRQVIYEDRHAVLACEDMRERCFQILARATRRVVDDHTMGALQDWDRKALEQQLTAWGVVIPENSFPHGGGAVERRRFADVIVAETQATYRRKVDSVLTAAQEHDAIEPSEYYIRQFEHQVILQVIDNRWQAHLERLDTLRTASVLHRIAGQDPLVQFKREAFEAFEQLKGDIEHDIADLLLRGAVHIQVASPIPFLSARMAISSSRTTD